MSLESSINATNGPFLEVGGPSETSPGRIFVDNDKITKPRVISNIEAPHAIEQLWGSRLRPGVWSSEPPHKGRLSRFNKLRSEGLVVGPIEEKLDLVADATALDVPDGSIGTLFAKGLPAEIEKVLVTTEAPRVIEPGGILVVEIAKKNTPKDATPYFDEIAVRKNTKNTVHYAGKRNDVPYSKDS